ncbi:response regulator [Negadavirga shengliensis]|uniref:Response regulator n=1 Tax=Negadavirga shengliensis TaxID=1389218 RepID=A0ABV9T233_9BACT
MDKPSILVADDHPLLLKGLVDELLAKNYNVVAQATTGLQALEAIMDKTPCIAILDIEMPLFSGMEILAKAKKEGLKTKFIILTSHKEEDFIYKARELGIDGYLLKEEPISEIEKCIQKVQKGETYFSNTFKEILETAINPQLQKLKLLSPSERTILRMVAQSLTSKEIAGQLLISFRTVQKHRSNIIHKLDINIGEEQLDRWAQRYRTLILSL